MEWNWESAWVRYKGSIFAVLREHAGAAKMVLGIPTVKREFQTYLQSTLDNLINNMSPKDKEECVIIVLIAEVEQEVKDWYIPQPIEWCDGRFPEHIESGLLEIIAPPASYYPDFDKLPQTLGDSPDRVKWRTKQNLDYSYLMMYAQPKGTFYVQLEDDILTKPGYLDTMMSFAYKQLSLKRDWMILDFCQLGFIGKMFKSVELSQLVVFFVVFHKDKPVDWLLDHLVQTKVCRFDKDSKDCKKRKDAVWIHYKPSLFQHVGTHSSLKGKVQKLKDKQFGKVPLHVPHNNPPAEIGTNLKAYKSYTLPRAYRGETFFWGVLPQAGDFLYFNFTPPAEVERYFIRSGNAEHPKDRFYNTSVEVLPVQSFRSDFGPRKEDGYLPVGRFNDQTGLAEGTVPPDLGPLQSLRLCVEADADHWAIISEVRPYSHGSTALRNEKIE
ncbi:MGAT4B, partial [Cordylochernes scorpioides]